jgi:drug/metabolite transporter (DMT)-like permease
MDKPLLESSPAVVAGSRPTVTVSINAPDDVAGDGALATPETQPEESAVMRHLVLVLMVALVVVGVANNVLSKLLYNTFGPYAFFVNQAVNLLYLALSLVSLAYKLAFTNDITRAQLNFPKFKFLVMATLDALAGFLAAVSSQFTPGQQQTILNLLVIPITMVSAFLFLKTRFPRGQQLGAAIVILGAAVAVVPSLVSGAGSGDGGGGGGAAAQMRWYAVLIYFTSNFPTAFSSVYKEAAFRVRPAQDDDGGDADSAVLLAARNSDAADAADAAETDGEITCEDDLDVFLLTAYVTTFQLLVGFMLVPLLAVPGFGGISLREIPANLRDGFRCFRDSDPLTAAAGEGDGTLCEHATLILLLYVGVNFAFNLLNLAITKHASASLTAIAYSVRLPLVNIAYTVRPLMGRWAERFSAWSIAGLVVTLGGFSLYQYSAPRSAEEEPEGYVEAFTALPPQSAGFELKKAPPKGSEPIAIARRRRVGSGPESGPLLRSAPI